MPSPPDHKPINHKSFNGKHSDAPDPAEGTPAEQPSGPFPPPPMPDVLKRAGPDEPTRAPGPISRGPSALQSSRVFAVGMDFVYAFIGATALGWGADWLFKTSPRWLLIGAGVGVVVGMYRFITEGLKLGRQGGR